MVKETMGNGVGPGEISTIRQILMGQQISEFERRFEEANNKLEALDKLYGQKLESLEAEFQRRTEAMEKDMLQRLHDLQRLLETHVEDWENQLSRSRSQDKWSLGEMLQELGAKLQQG